MNMVSNNPNDVLNKWKTDYDELYNKSETPFFDNQHLNDIKNILSTVGDTFFQEVDCDFLNAPITRDEVKASIYKAKLRKACGNDGIPADVLRNDICIDLLHSLITNAFDLGQVPDEWMKSIINPIYKSDDPRDPLNYRPISLISVPCKIYTNVLNERLCKWLDYNNIISDFQNGFRKERSCLDHIYTLNNIVKNRKNKKQDTFACFVDYKKAFDSVQRDCLWFKLKYLGLHGKILKAIQSLYESVSCSVKVNKSLTDWFPVTTGLKQGCNLSPTLFSMYINDLVQEINQIDSGIVVDDVTVSILMYADDVILLASSESKLQAMLEKLQAWCKKMAPIS